jgi:FkbM family methyltransferase
MRYHLAQIRRAVRVYSIATTAWGQAWIILAAVFLGLKRFVPGIDRVSLPIRVPSGHRLWIADVSELRVLGEIFVDGIYDVPALPSTVSFILDLGANCGAATAFFLSRFPSAQIIAYEVDPQVAARARRGLAGAAVEIHTAAVSDSPNPVRIFRPRGRSWETSAYAGGGASFLAPGVSLDTIIGERHIGIMKLDIEGSEHAALRSCSRLAQVDLILGEFHPMAGCDADTFFEMLHAFDLIEGGGPERAGFVARRRRETSGSRE